MESGNIRVTILCDEQAEEGLAPEHGFSLWIEAGGRKVLFDTGGPFSLDPEGKRPDPIEDDLALWIRTGAGAIVCLGCAHAGLVNTLSRIRRLTGDGKIRAVIGGFHLLNASSARLGLTADFLRRLGPELVVPCHCTGDAATAELRDALGKAVSPGRVGAAWRF